MGSDINAVIDSLCLKFGTTAEFLVPEIARYKVVLYGTLCGIGLLLGFGALIFLIVTYRKYDDYKSNDTWVSVLLISGFISVVGFIMFLANISDLLAWIISPYGAVVHMIVR